MKASEGQIGMRIRKTGGARWSRGRQGTINNITNHPVTPFIIRWDAIGHIQSYTQGVSPNVVTPFPDQNPISVGLDHLLIDPHP